MNHMLIVDIRRIITFDINNRFAILNIINFLFTHEFSLFLPPPPSYQEYKHSLLYWFNAIVLVLFEFYYGFKKKTKGTKIKSILFTFFWGPYKT